MGEQTEDGVCTCAAPGERSVCFKAFNSKLVKKLQPPPPFVPVSSHSLVLDFNLCLQLKPFSQTPTTENKFGCQPSFCLIYISVKTTTALTLKLQFPVEQLPRLLMPSHSLSILTPYCPWNVCGSVSFKSEAIQCQSKRQHPRHHELCSSLPVTRRAPLCERLRDAGLYLLTITSSLCRSW